MRTQLESRYERPLITRKENIFFYIHSNTFKMQILGSLDALSSLTIYFIFTNDF